MLQLDDNFRIVVDSCHQNWILEKLETITDRKTKETRTDYKIVGYFGANLSSLLKRYKKEALINSDLSIIEEVLYRLDDVERFIEQKVKKENIKLGNLNG